MRSLYELEISVQSAADIADVGGHCEITIEEISYRWSGELDLFGAVSEADVLAARRHMAGVLGRLMAALVGWVDAERLAHGCRPWADEDSFGGMSVHETCFVASSPDVIRPGDDFGSSVALWIFVPECHLKAWLERIRHYLAVIAEADAESRS